MRARVFPTDNRAVEKLGEGRFCTNTTFHNLLFQWKMLVHVRCTVVKLRLLLSTQIYNFMDLTALATWVVTNEKPVY